MKDMLSLFQQVFFGEENDKNEEYMSEDESWSDSDESINKTFNKKSNCIITAEEANKNADALIAEEEREKKKAEKRKAKKKRRKEKKKLEKGICIKEKSEENVTQIEYRQDQDRSIPNSSSSETEEESIDPNSAFVAVAANKSRRNSCNIQRKVNEEKLNIAVTDDRDLQNCKNIDPRVLRSRQVAIRGNEMAGVGQFQEAVNLFTEAIKLDPSDYRFFGNRSYCYDRLGLYEKALKDSEKAISLSSRWPKGYFRKGRAMVGLKKYGESEKAFQIVLKLDEDCTDAQQELNRVYALQLIEMGFSKQQSEMAIRQFGNIQTALEALVSGAEIDCQAVGGETEIYISDDDDFYPQVPTSNNINDKMDPRNPDGQVSIWVGNVQQNVTEKTLWNLFAKCGEVVSLRILPEKFCAFINYSDKKSAGNAMKTLQGFELSGQRLLIRYPNNPLSTSTITAFKKSKLPCGKPVEIEVPKQKVSGPINGDECYFWRTTGCIYGNQCRYKHIKEHERIDRKPWQERNE